MASPCPCRDDYTAVAAGGAASRTGREHFVEQAEIPAFVHLLVGGVVELLGVDGANEVPIETVQPVDLLLPAAVLNQQPHLARARVLEEAHLVLIHADAFRDAVARDHALCLAVLACQAAQFRRQMKLAKDLINFVRRRIASAVICFASSTARTHSRPPSCRWRSGASPGSLA